VSLRISQLILVLLLLVQVSCNMNSVPEYSGTLLDSHDSHKFSLVDHSNRVISTSNHGSNVALLTFMFTECTDVCPIITHSIKKSLSEIPENDRIPVIIVSVDPENDSTENMTQFINKWDLSSNWSFISGNKSDLSPIWNSYFINPQKYNNSNQGSIKKLNDALIERQTVIHSSPVYILDKDGNAILVHTNPINTEDLYSDIIEVMNN